MVGQLSSVDPGRVGTMIEPHKVTLSVDVADRAPSGCNFVEVDLYLPAELESSAVLWCCVPGGGVTRAYFDLDVPPEVGEYSMARVLARCGSPVLLIDPPGTGGSDVPDDGYLLTPQRVSEVLHAVVTEVKDQLSLGGVEGAPAIECQMTLGVGHSAGGLLVACQQAHHQTFDALVLLGFSDTGLVEVLNQGESAFIGHPDGLIEALPELARSRFGGPLPARPYSDLDNPLSTGPMDPVREADARAATRLLALVGLMAIIPGSMKPELDKIAVPTFAAIGEHDIAGDIGLLVSQLPACHDLTLVTLPGVGHNHNLSDSRFSLWNRMDRWVGSLDPTDQVLWPFG
jgi:pimeloyl-ACP methyl ester carboxylesterase